MTSKFEVKIVTYFCMPKDLEKNFLESKTQNKFLKYVRLYSAVKIIVKLKFIVYTYVQIFKNKSANSTSLPFGIELL